MVGTLCWRAVSRVDGVCRSTSDEVIPVMADSSRYVASPGYPDRHYMFADCYWRLVTLRRQLLRVTIVDFELDVRRAGHCHDRVDIHARPRGSIQTWTKYFSDCGALGKHVIDIKGNEAVVRFVSGGSGPAQRGFLLHVECKSTITSRDSSVVPPTRTHAHSS